MNCAGKNITLPQEKADRNNPEAPLYTVCIKYFKGKGK